MVFLYRKGKSYIMKKQNRFATYRKLVEKNKSELTEEELKQIDNKIEKRLMDRQTAQSK
jgi:ABC-type Fe3+/spermidine/putrescine transport system ATPase subunit